MVGDILVNTLMNTGVYAMLAVGFSLMFGVARLINLAHTAFYMLAGYSIFFFITRMGLPWLASVLLSILIVVVVAVVVATCASTVTITTAAAPKIPPMI